MTQSNLTVPLVTGLALLAASTAWAFPPAGTGGCDTCAAPGCGPTKVTCPPYFYHYFEGAPKLKFKRGCPRPICDPCNLPHYGYFQTCWAPWPYPDDWGHCTTPTSSQMLPPPEKPLFAPKVAIPVPPVETGKTPTTPPDRPKPGTTKPDLPAPKPLDGDKGPKPLDGDKGPMARAAMPEVPLILTTTQAPLLVASPAPAADVPVTRPAEAKGTGVRLIRAD